MPGPVRRILGYIPGTIIISIIAPQVAQGGWITLSASVLCVAVSLAAENMVVAMVVTVVYVSLLRNPFLMHTFRHYGTQGMENIRKAAAPG